MIQFKYIHKALNGKPLSRITYEVLEEGGDIYDMMQEYKHFLLAIGFTPDTVKEVIDDD